MNYDFFLLIMKNYLYIFILKWGLGIGDWGLGIGGLAQSPNPKTPTPTPYSPFLIFFIL